MTCEWSEYINSLLTFDARYSTLNQANFFLAKLWRSLCIKLFEWQMVVYLFNAHIYSWHWRKLTSKLCLKIPFSNSFRFTDKRTGKSTHTFVLNYGILFFFILSFNHCIILLFYFFLTLDVVFFFFSMNEKL